MPAQSRNERAARGAARLIATVPLDRAHQRHGLTLRVEVRHGDATIVGESANVSLGGMLILLQEPVPFGTGVMLTFRIPALKDDATVAAVVRWTTDDAIGVEFIGLRAIEVWGLNQLLQRPAG
jgi:PilZ domain-containing protein